MKNLFLFSFILLNYAFSESLNADHFKHLKFRFIGPDGNRAISVVGVSSDHNTYYVGAASGGLFRTENNGISWQPIFDDQDVSSVSALAISQKNPKVLWAGTGETFIIRPAHALGDGIYKSMDGGDTWKNMGLKKTARIARIIVHPENDDIVYAAALGHTFGPQKERGVYRTTDGGKTWKKILGIIENMSYFECTSCGEKHEIFSHGGIEKKLGGTKVKLLGEIPLIQKIRECGDIGIPFASSQSDEKNIFKKISKKIINLI